MNWPLSGCTHLARGLCPIPRVVSALWETLTLPMRGPRPSYTFPGAGKVRKRYKQRPGKAPPPISPERSFGEMLATAIGVAIMRDYASVTRFFAELSLMKYSMRARMR